MKELLKVSIIIPVHNSESSLARCIDSVISQSYKNIECILIENGSTDKSKALCSIYGMKYENVIVESTKVSGVSNARNKGLALAKGDIVGFCDSDDFLEPGAIQAVVNEFLTQQDIVAVFGGVNIGVMKPDGYIVKDYKGIKEQSVSISKALQLILINDSIMGGVWNKYYKADVLKNICFDSFLSFCEDMHFNAKVLDSIQKSKKVKIISIPLYCYMDNPESITHNKDILFDNNNELKYIVALKKIEKDCKLNKKMKELVGMKIACFSIDFLISIKLDEVKRQNLLNDLKENYIYLVIHMLKNNWKWNVKRVLYGFKILFVDGR